MFDDSNLWCDDCGNSNSGECNRHGELHVVPDSPFVSRARQSLPSILELKESRDRKQGLAVFSRVRIQRRTRFGPLKAPRKHRPSFSQQALPAVVAQCSSLPFKLLGVSRREPAWLNIDAVRNEERSNWMVFVAVARTTKEQNLVAFQYRAGIYFVTIKDIAVGEELRVWYAKEYAACLGIASLAKTSDSSSSHSEGSSSPPLSRSDRQLRSRALLPSAGSAARPAVAPTSLDTCPSCRLPLPVSSPRAVEGSRSRSTRHVCVCQKSPAKPLTKASLTASTPRKKPALEQRTGRKLLRSNRGGSRGGSSTRAPELISAAAATPPSTSSAVATVTTSTTTMSSFGGNGKKPSKEGKPPTTIKREETTPQPTGSRYSTRMTTAGLPPSLLPNPLEPVAGPSGLRGEVEVKLEEAPVVVPPEEVFVGDWSMPGTSRQGLRSSVPQFEFPPIESRRRRPVTVEEVRRGLMAEQARSKKDIKNEQNIQRVSASSQVEGGSATQGLSAALEMVSTSPERVEKKRVKGSSSGRHVCPVCSKAFGSPGKLGQHMYSHTGERPFECTQCNKAFSSKFKLVRHVLIHSDERRYRCTVCERTFHRKDHLKNHVKVHSPVKKTFRCEREGCGKEYSSFLSFRKHVAVHAAEEGNLECKMCGKVFATKEEIVYHLKVHAGSRTVKNPSDKKYRCDHCERKFFTRKDVRRHLVVHTGKRDFLCQFCPQRFGRKDHLVRHIKKSHHNAGSGALSRQKGTRRRPTSTVVRESEQGPSGIRRPPASRGKSSQSETSSRTQEGGYTSEESAEEFGIEEPSPVYPETEESKSVLLLEETGQTEESLKLSDVESVLHPPCVADQPPMLKTEVPQMPVERSTVTVHHHPRPTPPEELLSSLMFTPAVPPPPYPATTPSFKPFAQGASVKLEFPTPGPSRLPPTEGGMEFSHFLSLIPPVQEMVEGPSTVQEELQRLLSGGDSGSEGHLLVSDPNLNSQFLHLMQTAATSLEMPGAVTSDSPGEIIASLLEAPEDVTSTRQSQTPLPRFNQAFQQQQQQQQPQQPPSQPQPPVTQPQQSAPQQPPPPP